MSYSQGNPLVDLENFQSAIKTTALSNVWIGSASSALVGTLTRLMNKLEVEKNNLNRYFNALNQLEVYKQNKKKIKFMVSNSNTVEILKLYDNYNIEQIFSSRSISSNGEKRGKIREIIIRNY